jgi:hypothetical protein
LSSPTGPEFKAIKRPTQTKISTYP